MRVLTLKPTHDAVFKMLFTRGPDANAALIGLLTAVLQPLSPITEIVVENPEILPDVPGGKLIVLDIKVRFQDGTRCDVEMQTTREAAFPERVMMYGARTLGGQLVPGDAFGTIRPVYVIALLAYEDSRFPAFHASYRMREDGPPHGALSPTLVTHVVSLTRWTNAEAALRPAEAKLLDWAKLLSADTFEAAVQAAGEDPAMLKAAAALDRLQDDPQARELAAAVELAREWQKVEAAAQRAEGRDEGLQAGREEGLRRAVLDVCEVLGIELERDAAAEVAAMDADSLSRLLDAIKANRRWPG